MRLRHPGARCRYRSGTRGGPIGDKYVLRAIGATQGQLKMMVVAEAGWMGLAGGILGLLSGTIISYHHVVYNTKVLTGWTFQYHYPFGVALACLVLAVILCLLAAYVPARKAASTNIVTAVGYE